MIRHIVLFSAKQAQDAAAIKQALEAMGDIPGVRFLEVALNEKKDRLSQEIDVVLYSEFDSYEDLDAYQNHPRHLAAIDIVRPLRDQRVVVDYTAAVGRGGATPDGGRENG